MIHKTTILLITNNCICRQVSWLNYIYFIRALYWLECHRTVRYTSATQAHFLIYNCCSFHCHMQAIPYLSNHNKFAYPSPPGSMQAKPQHTNGDKNSGDHWLIKCNHYRIILILPKALLSRHKYSFGRRLAFFKVALLIALAWTLLCIN